MIQIWDFAAFIFARLAQIKWATKHIQTGTIFTRVRNKAAPDIPNLSLVVETKLTSFLGSSLYVLDIMVCGSPSARSSGSRSVDVLRIFAFIGSIEDRPFPGSRGIPGLPAMTRGWKLRCNLLLGNTFWGSEAAPVLDKLANRTKIASLGCWKWTYRPRVWPNWEPVAMRKAAMAFDETGMRFVMSTAAYDGTTASGK